MTEQGNDWVTYQQPDDVQSMNEAIIAQMTLPPHLVQEINEFKQENERIRNAEMNIARCEETTREMLGILDGFNRKILKLEDEMVGIHKNTSQLTTAQRNIDSAMTEVKTLKENYDIINERDEDDRRIAADTNTYLDWVTQLNIASAYWARNTNLRGAERAQKRLKDMLKKVVNECEQEFARLVSTHTRPIDLVKIGWPLPPSFELMPISLIERLSRIAQAIDMSGKNTFLDIFQVHRMSVVKQTIKRTMQDKYNPLISSASSTGTTAIAAAVTGAVGGGFGLGAETKMDQGPGTIASTGGGGSGSSSGGGDEKLGRYVKGTHRTLFHLEMFVKLGEMEYDLWANVCKLSSVGITGDYGDRFLLMMEEPLDSFLRLLDQSLKGKAANKPLHLLDILSTLHQLTPRYRDLLRKGSDQLGQFGKVMEFRRQAMEALRRAIAEYITYIETAPATPRKDGTILPLVVETLGVLKQFASYVDVLKSLPRSALVEEPDESKTGQSIVSTLSSIGSTVTSPTDSALSTATGLHLIVGLVLRGLEKCLAQNAKSFSKAPALSALFMLNNCHYITKTATRSKLDMGPVWERRFRQLVAQHRDAYRHATWDKLLEYLSIAEAKEIHSATVNGKVPEKYKPIIKSRFAGFNSIFDQLYGTHRYFSVPDSDLRGELRAESVDLVLKKYSDFLEAYGNLDFSSKPGKYIKYNLQVVETMLNKFFDEMS